MDRRKDVSAAVEKLKGDFSGILLLPDDKGYEVERHVHNGLIDKHPAIIARCIDQTDIVKALQLARQLSLEVAIRGGGHNVSGRATVEGGMMVDMSLMRKVEVDADARSAVAQTGATWADFNLATQAYGLATPGGFISSTGIAGLTLGGGFGWITSKYGLAVDNLLSAEVVMANGEILNASQDENADLFWALRGAGANFGVVVSLKYRLHEVGPAVFGGFVAHPMEKAGDLFRVFRDVTATLQDDETAIAGLLHAPDGSGTKLAVVAITNFGAEGENSRSIRKVREFGTPLIDNIASIGYSELNTLMDGAFPKGALNYWKSNFLERLDDEAIDTMIESFAVCPAPLGQVMIEHFHGAVTRVAVEDTAVPLRKESFNFLALSQWIDPAATDVCVAWARETNEAMKPFMGKDRYVNYLGDDEPETAAAAAYGENFARLRKIKSRYDPENFFHMNQNIPPENPN
ncbi:MAG: FAD-binding oxidoreductase [Acidobacteriota bacterium]